MNVDKKNQKGLASFVLGIIGIVFFFMPYVAIVPSILAIVYSKKQRKINSTGLSKAGLVIGIIGLVINGLFLLLILIAILELFLLNPNGFV